MHAFAVSPRRERKETEPAKLAVDRNVDIEIMKIVPLIDQFLLAVFENAVESKGTDQCLRHIHDGGIRQEIRPHGMTALYPVPRQRLPVKVAVEGEMNIFHP